MKYEYTHSRLGDEIDLAAGYYCKLEEGTMVHGEKTALYFLGNTSSVSSCCAGFIPPRRYVMVPGYVKDWQYRQNEEGFPVTAIELITKKETQAEIREILQKQYDTEDVYFW